MKLICQHVSAGDAGDEIFQVLFEENIDDDNAPYLLLQRAFLEEDEGDDDPPYVETNVVQLTGHHANLCATLTRNSLTVSLPPQKNDIITIEFDITDIQFDKVKRILSIIFQKNLEFM